SLYDGFSWLLDNQQDLAGLFDAFMAAIPAAAQKQAGVVQSQLYTAFRAAIPTMLSFAAKQLGLSGLAGEIQRALEFVPQTVDAAIRSAVATAASAVLGAAPGGTKPGSADVFNGLLAPAREFQYQGNTYVLWAAQDKKGAAAKIAQKTG